MHLRTPPQGPVNHPHAPLWLWLVLAVLAWLALWPVAPAAAAGAPSRAQIEEIYQQDRMACLSGITQQERPACLREAGAARAEALRGRLASSEVPAEQLQRNALLRCQNQKGDDQALCERRVREGRSSGSVEGGGLLRELEVQVPAGS